MILKRSGNAKIAFNVRMWGHILIFTVFVAVLLIVNGCGGKKEGTVGVDPLSDIVKVENNVRALSYWAQNNVKADVLVRFDTSDDMVEFVARHEESMKQVAEDLGRGKIDKLNQISGLVENSGVVNLGYMAGFYKRVVWVVPVTHSTGLDTAETFKRFLVEQRGYRMEALDDLRLDGKYITGTLTGVPITITNLEDLDIGEETALVDIDLAYFGGLKLRIPDYQPGTRALLGFLGELRKKGLVATNVTITLSTVKGLVPMDIRYYGDFVKEALGDPGPLGGAPSEKWTMMMEAEDSLIAGNYEHAESLYVQLIEENPRESGLFFALAVSSGFLEKAEDCGEALSRAYQLDGAYLRGIFQLASVLGASGRLETGEKVLELPMLANIISPVEMNYQKGLFYLSAGRPRSAASHLQQVANQRPRDFALQTVLHRAYREAGDTQGIARTLGQLIRIDEARVARDMPWVYKELGILLEDKMVLLAAADMYEKYLSLVPDDPDATELATKIIIFRNQ